MAVWQTCGACGALVADVDTHIAWHTKLASIDPAVPEAPILTLPDDPNAPTPASTQTI